jgi:uncharacterized protein (DUF1778 family)
MTAKKTPKKTDALTLRLDPRTKYLIEMTSRLGHQTITGVIESAVKRQAQYRKVLVCGEETTLSAAYERLWAPEESERTVNMILFAPSLLSHEELCIKNVLEAASHIFFNLYHVPPSNVRYREHYFHNLKGAFQQDEDGVLMFATPKKRTIRLCWDFIKLRAAELAEKGTVKDFTAEEIELLLGRPLDSISPLVEAPKFVLEEDEAIAVRGADKEDEDLMSSLRQRS